MSKEYEIRLEVVHTVFVEADSREEALEYAWDQFSDDAGFWDETWEDFINEEEI